MLRLALIFFIIAIVAAVFGFGGIAGRGRHRQDPFLDIRRAVPHLARHRIRPERSLNCPSGTYGTCPQTGRTGKNTALRPLFS